MIEHGLYVGMRVRVRLDAEKRGLISGQYVWHPAMKDILGKVRTVTKVNGWRIHTDLLIHGSEWYMHYSQFEPVYGYTRCQLPSDSEEQVYA